jgi:hypothetical protein
MKYTFLILFLLVSLYGYSQYPSYSFWTKNQVNITDSIGQKQGWWISDYNFIQFKNDTIDGNFIEFHENGKISFWYEFKKGLLWNLIACFDTSGNLINGGNIINGNGILYCFHPADSLWWQKHIESGLPPILSPKSDKVWICQTIKNGVVNGITKTFDYNGFLESEVYEKQDSLQPFLIDTFNYDGHLEWAQTNISSVGIKRYFLPETYIVHFEIDCSNWDEYTEKNLDVEEYYIPYEYQTRKRLKKLEKLKKRRIKELKKYGLR